MREKNTGCTAEEENEPETYMLREGVGLLVDYFRNRFPDLEEYRVRYLPVIEMLAASPTPLPERAVGEILHRGRAETRALLDELGPFFPVSPISSAFFGNEGEPETFVSISSEYGSALRSWLRSPAAGGYAADERRGHQRLAERGYLRYRKHGPEGLSWAMFLQLPVHLIESGMAGSCAAYLADPRVRERAAELGVSLPEGIGFYFRRLASEEGEQGDPRTEELPVIVLPRDAVSSLFSVPREPPPDETDSEIQRPVHSVHERLACEGGRSRKRKPVRNGQISGLSDRLHHLVRQVGVPLHE